MPKGIKVALNFKLNKYWGRSSKIEINIFICYYKFVVLSIISWLNAVKHEEIFSGSKDGFLPLEHKPGEVQVDFGAADFYENGLYISGKYLGVSFPYSNKGYIQLFYGDQLWIVK